MECWCNGHDPYGQADFLGRVSDFLMFDLALSTTLFQVKVAIVDKISNIMIDKTGQKNRTGKIGTTGRRDMGASMTGLTNSHRHNHLINLETICIVNQRNMTALVMACV